jgi:hypothetical protein
LKGLVDLSEVVKQAEQEAGLPGAKNRGELLRLAGDRRQVITKQVTLTVI